VGQGWIQFEKKTEDGQTHVGVAINKEKFQQDRDKLKKAAGERSKALKDQLAKLRDKAKGLTGADKEKAEKEIDTLSKKHEAFEAKVKDLEGVAEDRFEAIKKDIEGHLQETGKEDNK
jgi:predicted  nucleic acid-binding Zn-ribbon protein